MQPDSMAIVWKPVKGASPPTVGYDLYVNGAKVGSPVREKNSGILFLTLSYVTG